jgi:hypothetical protein
MNNLKNYDEYVNEGLYTFLNKKNTEKGAERQAWALIIGTLVGGIAALIMWAAGAPRIAFFVDLMAWGVVNLPLGYSIWRAFNRSIYDHLRAGTLKHFASDKIKELEGILEEYPDLEASLAMIKIQMRTSILNKDKKKISAGIHDICQVAIEIKNRKKIPEMQAREEKIRLEKEKELKQKYPGIFDESDKEKIIKDKIGKVDPYQEEDWTK